MSASEWRLTAENARLVRKSVGENVLRERARAGMSHRTLARASGISKATIANIEAARREPELLTLVACSFGLDVPLTSLLVGVPSPSVNEGPWIAGHAKGGKWMPTADSARLIREIVGRNLRREREGAGMSQRALAGEGHIGEDTIVRTESSRQQPKLFTLVAFSFGLNVPLTSLLMEIPSPAPSQAVTYRVAS
jgi:transcriptional regulator with XRE-family HTH domain